VLLKMTSGYNLSSTRYIQMYLLHTGISMTGIFTAYDIYQLPPIILAIP
jgi:hypothetical protein